MSPQVPPPALTPWRSRGARVFVAIPALAIAFVAGMAMEASRAGAAQANAPYQGTADDFMQISQLFSRYSYNLDNRYGVAWADDFAPDGEFQDPSLCVKGRAGLIDIVGRTPRPGGDITSHHVPELGPILYQDRDHATVRSTLVTYRERGPGKPEGGVNMTGVYADRLVRLHGKWVFAHRTVYRLSDKPAVPCGLTP